MAEQSEQPLRPEGDVLQKSEFAPKVNPGQGHDNTGAPSAELPMHVTQMNSLDPWFYNQYVFSREVEWSTSMPVVLNYLPIIYIPTKLAILI